MKDLKTLIINVVGLLILSIFGLLSFCNAGSFTYTGNIDFPGNNSSNRYITYLSIPYQSYDNTLTGLPIDVSCTISNYINNNGDVRLDIYAFVILNSFSTSQRMPYNGTLGNGSFSFSLNQNNILQYSYLTFRLNGTYQNSLSFDWSCTFSGDSIMGGVGSCPECEVCSEIDTGAILSGYIAISDITDNYCISNGLCGEISTGMSTLYINDIRHESRPFLYVNIPEEFEWEYTGNIAQMFIDIKGYNTDSDYIAGIINTQNSKPNSTDFTNIVSGLIPLLIPGLVIILFVRFIFKFIKKIF